MYLLKMTNKMIKLVKVANKTINLAKKVLYPPTHKNVEAALQLYIPGCKQ